MFLILFLRNLLFIFNNILFLLQIIKTKSLKNLKKIFLFLIFYLFLNLYLMPTLAFCDIDFELLDRENNTYKGSKIVYETPEVIVTQEELDLILKISDIIQVICLITIITTLIYIKINK